MLPGRDLDTWLPEHKIGAAATLSTLGFWVLVLLVLWLCLVQETA